MWDKASKYGNYTSRYFYVCASFYNHHRDVDKEHSQCPRGLPFYPLPLF